jgi:lysophospholipase L1-like esterase
MFKLDFDIPKQTEQIKIKDQIICIGSCFSENIAKKLTESKFQVVSNPFGTLFNPLSIFQLLEGQIDETRIVERNGIWAHWDLHSSLSQTTKEALIKEINTQTTLLQNKLQSCKWLIITFGTSFVYKLKSDGTFVANCHKFPKDTFEKTFLSADQIADSFNSLLEKLRSKNPDIQVILTVSPVRHTKDGLQENNISKGILHQSVKKMLEADSKTHYFPSYEIMIDELRDYRFYNEDMIHPSEQAINYIWDKFRFSSIEDDSNSFITEWGKIRSALAHKPFIETSEQHQNFLRNLHSRIEKFDDQIDVNEELQFVKSQLITK